MKAAVKKLPLIFLLLLIAIMVMAGCGKSSSTPQQPSPDNSNKGTLTGAELVDTRCDQCHSLDRVTRERNDEEWQAHAQRMLDKSPEMMTEDEYDLVVAYLRQSY